MKNKWFSYAEDICEWANSMQNIEIISIIPQRCETMQYKIEGKGNVIIYSITYDISEGSEL